MTIHPRAGTLAPADLLVDVGTLCREYYRRTPDVTQLSQRVKFGATGHCGSSLLGTFTEAHVIAMTKAICDVRHGLRISGPLYIGRDTHALSEPAFMTALEVLAAAGVETMIDCDNGHTPTPAVSHAILAHNRVRIADLADGIVITPSDNLPDHGGFKYSPPTGGPADADVTRSIEDRANQLLAGDLTQIPRMAYERARRAATTHSYDYVGSYVRDLAMVVDLDIIRRARLKIGVDPLGGASTTIWHSIAERCGVEVEVINDAVDPTFGFMPLDWDGKIRMDCSSPHAMATLIGLKDRFDIAFGNDADANRHGVVTHAGLMESNQYLATAIAYLFTHRPRWRSDLAVGKSIVCSSVIDRVAAKVGRALIEVPVGFTWFVPGLLEGRLGFGGEENGGASFLRRDGTVWSSDKDGIIMDLLAAELMARTNRDPSEMFADLTSEIGASWYARIDAPATAEETTMLASLSPADVRASELAGDLIETLLTVAPGNGEPIGGLKVVTAQGWFAARPSGTESYRLYAESFRGAAHLHRIQEEAQALIGRAVAGAMR